MVEACVCRGQAVVFSAVAADHEGEFGQAVNRGAVTVKEVKQSE